MRKSFLLACLLLATTTITAQDIIIKGHVVNERNSAVEYATVGIPGTRYGTLTGIDGRFEFTLPQNCNDTLVVTHVSYGEARIPPEAYMNTDSALVVTMQSHKLGEVVVYNGKRKSAKLQNKGVRIAGAVTSWNIDNIGNEVGSIIEVKHAFEIERIVFNTMSNNIESAKLSVNIYSINETEETFTNVIHHPVYIGIPTGDKKHGHTVLPKEKIFLEPGRYYISLKFVDGKGHNPKEERILFPLYLKNGYVRNSAVDFPEKIPVNPGLQIIGFEYK